ncbi:MAG TPA: hypothetical protein VFG47_20725 [Geminicoccaceae bacterium]|nr:hypothetical protein [Geminicoccaceae bacterium]
MMTVTVEVIVACTVRTDAAGGAAVGCGDAGAEPSGGSRYAAPFRPDGPGVPATSVAGGGPVAVESGRDGPGLVTVIY